MNNVLNFFKSNSNANFLAILTGLFVGTSYIPLPPWAVLFAYAPLWIAVHRLISNDSDAKEAKQSVSPQKPYHFYKKIFLAAWLSQVLLTLIGFNWIYYVSSEFGQLHWSLSLGALLLFAAFMHLYIPLSTVVAAWLIRHFRIETTWVRFVMMALMLSFFERLWPSIFEWNLAYTLLWAKIPLYQWADTVGFWGVSTWLLITQAFFAEGFLLWPQKKRKALEIMITTTAVLLFLTGLGYLKYQNWSKFDQTVQWGVAQGNIGNMDKIQSEQASQFHSYILNIYAQMTAKHYQDHPETEMMTWPETALPFALDLPFLHNFEQNQLLNLIQQWGRPLVTGGYSVDLRQHDHLGNLLTSNSVFFLGPNLKPFDEPYNKTDLLVFGEYMPFGETFPSLYKLLPFVGIYKKGPGPSLRTIQLRDKQIKLGPQVCYESLNPGFSRGLARIGTQIIFNLTNDSWFGWWAEPFQHQIMTLARAIEVRRPLVRSTNTGITSAILANGDLLQDSPINQSWTHTYPIRYLENPPLTFYTNYGYLDSLVWILFLFALIFIYRGKNKDVYH